MDIYTAAMRVNAQRLENLFVEVCAHEELVENPSQSPNGIFGHSTHPEIVLLH